MLYVPEDNAADSGNSAQSSHSESTGSSRIVDGPIVGNEPTKLATPHKGV